jgi:hypothetical protein
VGDLERVDPDRLPPRAFVPGAVDLAVVHPAERDNEFVARLASERARLRIAKMMGIRWLTAADEARHLDHRAQVLTVSVTTRRGEGQNAFINGRCRTALATFSGTCRSAAVGHDALCHWSVDYRRGVRR